MARQGQRQIIRRDAAAIIRNPDQCLAAVRIFHRDPAGTRINSVFHQLFHRRGGPLHHFARGDAVDRGVVQLPDNGLIFAYVGVGMRHSAKPSMGMADS